MIRPLQASALSSSGAAAVPAVVLPRAAGLSFRSRPVRGLLGLVQQNLRPQVCVQARKDDRKAESGAGPSAPSTDSSTEFSPFFEPLLRGLVLGIGAGILCELVHVAFKVTNIAIGMQLPSVALYYEQLAPLFVWDHAVAITFWLLFYVIEAGVILAILREYPDDKQAFRVIRSTPTLPKRLLPLKLSSVKRAIFALLNGRSPQAATQNAAPLAYRGGSAGAATLSGPRPGTSSRGGGGTAVLERPPPAAPQPPLQPQPQRQPASKKDGSARDVESADGEDGTSAALASPPSPPDTAPTPTPTDISADGSITARLRAAAGLRPGQLDPNSPLLTPFKNKAAKREKELADRRAYLQNFWYAAALSSKVTSKPLKVDILSRTVTIWRGEDGQVHCLDDVCPHRGAPLSSGWTKTKNGKSCVVCPYHGWAFNGEGALEEVPSQRPDVAFPRRPLLDSYPVQERGGFVWLFFGARGLPEDERPPLPLVPELEDPKWRPVYGEMEFDCPHWSVFDNALDMAHIHYLHSGSFGNQDKPVISDMKVARDTWSVSANFSVYNKPVNPLWNFSAVPSVPVEARALLPSTSYVKITLGGGIQMVTYVNTVPIDEHRAINRFCLIRNFALSPAFDGYTRKSMYRILGEDKAMIELLKPEQMAAEVSLEADRAQIAFRQLRQEWIDMGYGVQPEDVASHRGSLRLDM